MTNTGIKYGLTGDHNRGRVCDYHYKPQPLQLNKTPYQVDIAGLKPAQRGTAILTDGRSYESKFTIGFEIEKSALHRGAVKEYELLTGFERDGSCGYEAVTHILPLLPACSWRTKVYDMMHKATKIIDDRYSPSNLRCGGHVTVAVDGMDGDDIREHVRNYSGILLAMFRSRLGNHYCKHNATMTHSEINGHLMINGWHHKYQLALVKGDLLEFRVVARFQSVKQMMRRYELFYELLDFSINVKGSFNAFLNRIKPIVLSMYEGDEAKVKEIYKIAVAMQKMIKTNKINKDVVKYVDPDQCQTRLYDDELRNRLGL